ncbi:N-acetylmuramoyl-L-alanine amidase [Alloacidobacterium dinghuense]|uniref:N-acetylmuramoyl-L-alanine amidase n=1 Tax=Alloacidobacterium dinghuense TaxID=2763107 RepID=A0A7G8BHK6_9BACT|nr:N-acetylmuramoyl-L-alanine amidase [Alloacidobacterium dinghuense]QNI32026.1 N-acetylmuramoyl-L-alanine amidase [Alloacidobacterium dinghuense]
MPLSYRSGGRTLFLSLASAALFCALSCWPANAAPHQPHSPFDKAQRLREALEGRPEQQRTRRDYERVMSAYRAVYHGDPASPKADASILAVADLLAEQGRVFQDEKSLQDAIGQYEFLRKQYPASRYRFSALLTEGEIYRRDLEDRDEAKATFQQFLKLYPQSPLADEARQELKNIQKEEVAEKHGKRPAQHTTAPVIEAQTAPPTSAPLAQPSKHKAVVTPVFPSVTQPQPQQTHTAQVPPQPAPPAPAVQQPAPEQTSEPSKLSEAAMNAPPPPRKGKLPLVTGVRHWSTPIYTRVAIDLQDEVQYEATRVPGPDRIFFDLHGSKLSPELIGKSVEVTDDGFLKRIRVAQFSNDVTRVVLDVSNVSEYSAFLLPNPWRLIIDVHGSKPGTMPAPSLIAKQQPQPATQTPASNPPSAPATPPPAATTPSTVRKPSARTTSAANTTQEPAPSPQPTPQATADAAAPGSTLKDIASLDRQPNKVKATKHPTTAPVVQSVSGTSPEQQPNELEATNQPQPAVPPTPAPAKKASSKNNSPAATPDQPAIHAAVPTAAGERSMVRALGLKIGRIVVDAGHGGHDSGTLGPDGIEEKDVVLDVALRLGKLLKQRLGADVIYTRDDDTFIPLETRTAIANKAQADLFISVHANSSSDSSARGVETYYLNFTTSADALEVAARENAVSDQSIHQLSDLVKKITLQDKISESREFAADVQQSLYSGLEDGNPGLKDRGVKKAPFVVLIGANMPSILAEISFLTNPDDAHELRDPEYRERIAESLYRGVSRYVGSLSGVRIAQSNIHTSGN